MWNAYQKRMDAARVYLRYLIGAAVLVSFATLAFSAESSGRVDLSHAVIIAPAHADGPESAAIRLLVEETENRSGLRWQVRENTASAIDQCSPCVEVGRVDQLPGEAAWTAAARRPEAFHLGTSERNMVIAGQDDRGVLFGIGYLLRHIEFSHGGAFLEAAAEVYSAPRFAVRGHQLGYRFKNNTYDAWAPQQFEQYIRDLAVFGSNTIELLPPITDDAPSSPLFPLPAMEMMSRVSGIIKKYGLRCSVFYPAMAKDYADPKTVAEELQAWGDVFNKLPQLDEVFVPGGDPGHTDPAVLFPFLEKVAEVLHRSHPEAGIWVSAQGFNAEQMQRFYALAGARPAWLSGVVVGPQSRDGLEAQRAHIPKEIPIRFYPDITHSMHCQFPVPEWDPAYALTEGREVINPRPVAESIIFRHYAPYMSGFVTYSEGVNDDVNKFIWSVLGWSVESDPAETLHEYARYFAGGDGADADAFAQGILALERDWVGPLAANDTVDATLQRFQELEHKAAPTLLSNWRFEAALYRAYTDAYERHRLITETGQEAHVLSLLAKAHLVGSLKALDEAEHAIAPDPAAVDLLRPFRDRIEILAGQLFKNIGIQLSVVKYGASAVGRGASLDTADVSLNDRVWLERQFASIRSMSSEAERLKAVDEIAHRDDPGPGGFYDDLGDPTHEPHLVRGPGYPSDPALFETAQDGISDKTPDQGWRLSEVSYAGTLYGHPLEMRYTGLSPKSAYRLRIEYAGEDYATQVTLTTNGKVLNRERSRTSNPDTVEFAVPMDATRNGTLDLQWAAPKGAGGGGRGLQISEVWLIPQQHR